MGSRALQEAAVEIEGIRFVPMIGADELREGIARVAAEITSRYDGLNPLLVCVLNGAAIFHADLARMIPIGMELDYIRVASYHGEMSSSGTIIFTASAGTPAKERHVIIVEDIVDTGRTVRELRKHFMDEGAASVATAALLYKRDADRVGLPPDHVAFEIPNRFVVGFGLDYRGRGRNLPAIYVLDQLPPSDP